MSFCGWGLHKCSAGSSTSAARCQLELLLSWAQTQGRPSGDSHMGASRIQTPARLLDRENECPTRCWPDAWVISFLLYFLIEQVTIWLFFFFSSAWANGSVQPLKVNKLQNCSLSSLRMGVESHYFACIVLSKSIQWRKGITWKQRH